MLRRISLLAILVAVLAITGCGGDDGDEGGAGGGATTPATTETTPEEAGGGGADGKALFSGTCGGCHTLADAGTTGTVGPNLDDLKPDKARVLNAIKTGPSAMPENLFQGADADAVAEYVSSAAGQG